MDYAAAVNEEIRDLFAAGADIVQIDEPYMQARPQKAREYGLKALNRALQGVKGTTAVHICFGYAAIIHERPEGYSFLPEFHNCPVHQVSIETAQSNLDTAVLKTLPDKTIILGVIDLEDRAIEKPETVAARIRRALPYAPAERIIVAPDCGMKYSAARRRLRQAGGDGRGHGDRARGADEEARAARRPRRKRRSRRSARPRAPSPRRRRRRRPSAKRRRKSPARRKPRPAAPRPAAPSRSRRR